MLKKILILFLCFWMSCGSVFAAIVRAVDDYEPIEEMGERQDKLNQCEKNIAKLTDTLYSQTEALNKCMDELKEKHQQNKDEQDQTQDIRNNFTNGIAFSIGSLIVNAFILLLKEVTQNKSKALSSCYL